jgi:hypothetical protein
MDHLGISNTVDSTGEVRVVGVANGDVSYFSGFWVWQMKRPPRKLATNFFRTFRSYFVGRSQRLFVITESKNVFFYIRGKNMFANI